MGLWEPEDLRGCTSWQSWRDLKPCGYFKYMVGEEFHP